MRAEIELDDLFGEPDCDETRPVTADSYLVFDIETGPLPDAELDRVRPPLDESSLPSQPGEFDESSVKLGRLKDEDKIREKIDEARQSHANAVKNHAATCERIRNRHVEQFREAAPLSPITGQVLAIGMQCGQEPEPRIVAGGEREILSYFWSMLDGFDLAVGFNITNFDIPFLVRRSWIHSVYVPKNVFERNGRYLSHRFIDLFYRWRCASQFGDPKHVNSKLDTIAKFFGLDGKTEGVSGVDFHRLWSGSLDEQAKAKAYLLNDVKMTAEIAFRMGIL